MSHLFVASMHLMHVLLLVGEPHTLVAVVDAICVAGRARTNPAHDREASTTSSSSSSSSASISSAVSHGLGGGGVGVGRGGKHTFDDVARLLLDAHDVLMRWHANLGTWLFTNDAVRKAYSFTSVYVVCVCVCVCVCMCFARARACACVPVWWCAVLRHRPLADDRTHGDGLPHATAQAPQVAASLGCCPHSWLLHVAA